MLRFRGKRSACGSRLGLRFVHPQVAKLSNLNVYPDGPPTNPDPHFYRTGLPPPKEVADVILRTCAEAREALSHKKVHQQQHLRVKVVEGVRGGDWGESAVHTSWQEEALLSQALAAQNMSNEVDRRITR